MSRHSRLDTILELLSQHGKLDVEELVQALGVSAATVRRDLDRLADQQLLTRTHGGAVPTAASYDLPLRYKATRFADAKLRIARAGAEMVQAGQVVGFNGGTTTTEVARALARRAELGGDGDRPLTVVTNALNIATELAVRRHIKIVALGGVARPQSYELIGPLADASLTQINLDLVFLGVDAFDLEHGATASHEGEASVNRQLAARARRVVVVADHSKLGKSAFARICDADQVDALLTDAPPDPATAAALAARDVEVVVAD
ncbi:DeoR/GlpR family DNA-binding transcription regulator [Nocardioides sp. GXQ0305]|uniref:DeoR/GlpR family DNA-binding transcription regulator n=1 Tax=Nocardioides sp. GXQ0305 TaxID=3423912 RepID=UPI003D7C5571